MLAKRYCNIFKTLFICLPLLLMLPGCQINGGAEGNTTIQDPYLLDVYLTEGTVTKDAENIARKYHASILSEPNSIGLFKMQIFCNSLEEAEKIRSDIESEQEVEQVILNEETLENVIQ